MSTYIAYITLFVLWIVITWMLALSVKPVKTFIDSKMARPMKGKADTQEKATSPSPKPQPENSAPDPDSLTIEVRKILTGTHDLQNVGGGTAIVDVFGEKDPGNVSDAKIRCVFEPISDQDAISSLALAEAIRIHEVKLETIAKRKFVVSLAVENITNELITARIPKGQVFENKERGMKIQNLASWNGITEIELPPREIVRLRVDALCINRDWHPPKGEKGNITVFKMRYDFKEQKDLWSTTENSIRSYQQQTNE